MRHTPGLEAACEGPEKAHITLMMLGLAQPSDLERCSNLLSTLREALLHTQLLQPLLLDIAGLDTFREKVSSDLEKNGQKNLCVWQVP